MTRTPAMSTNRRPVRACPNEVTMSTGSTGRLHVRHETRAADQSPPLPFDVVLEIVERCDAATVILCAATCKLLHRAILGEDFRRRLALRVRSNGGFDPTLLLGVSYRFHEHDGAAGRLVQASGRRPRFDESLLVSFTPVASRDGILVLRKIEDASSGGGSDQFCVFKSRTLELCVCNTLTGHTSTPPSLSFCDESFTYPPALLTVVGAAGAGCSFELLVVDKRLSTQKYWSQDGKWVAGRAATISPDHRLPTPPVDSSSAAVTGRTVHWLCHNPRSNTGNDAVIVLSIDADATRATLTELPQGCNRWDTGAMDFRGLQLAGSDADGRLRLVSAGMQAISVWTLSPSSSETEDEEDPSRRWSQQVVIHRQWMGKSLFGESWKLLNFNPSGRLYATTRFMGFAERSGVGLLWMDGGGLVQFNLATRELVVVLHCGSEQDASHSHVSCVFLHEMDLPSLLPCY